MSYDENCRQLNRPKWHFHTHNMSAMFVILVLNTEQTKMYVMPRDIMTNLKKAQHENFYQM